MTEQVLADETRLVSLFRALEDRGVEYAVFGEAFSFSDLEIEVKTYGDTAVRVVTPRTLWRMKRDTLRPIDAQLLAERFDLEED